MMRETFLVNARLWMVTQRVHDELQTLYTHADLPKDDFSSPAAFRFWLANGDQMPLLATIAQMALVTPLVTTVIERTFGVLGVSLFLDFRINTTICRCHERQRPYVAHVVAGSVDASRGEHFPM